MSTHPLAALVKRRNRVAAAITDNVGPLGFDAARAAEAVLVRLPVGIDYSAVYRSLLPLGSGKPDATVVKEVAWAIAGDLPGLKAKRPVYPPTMPPAAVKVVIQFLAARRVTSRNSGDENKTCYRIRVVQGRMCPLVFEVIWPNKYIRYRAVHPSGLGFARPPKGHRVAKPTDRPYVHPDTLVGMLAKAMLVADPQTGRPKLTDVNGTPSLRTYNRALTELRYRANGFRCPFNFTHPCQDCPKGQASCQAACRPLDLVQALCLVCRCSDATVDPAWPNTPCVRCAGRRPNSKRSSVS